MPNPIEIFARRARQTMHAHRAFEVVEVVEVDEFGRVSVEADTEVPQERTPSMGRRPAVGAFKMSLRVGGGPGEPRDPPREWTLRQRPPQDR